MDAIIFIALFCLFQAIIIDIPFRRRIKESQTTNEAVKTREKFRKRRIIFLIVFSSIFIAFFSYITIVSIISDEKTNAWAEIIKSVFSLLLVLLISYTLLKMHNRLVGNISTLTKEQFLEERTRFNLYLRSFEKDNYSKKLSLSKPSIGEKFSEYWFIEVLRLKKATCAVGMTKETDSPLGATRIYLDDENWKRDVLELMEKADNICILVDDRPSCVWEIEQTSTLLQKTTFIIDDANKYNNAKKNTNNITLPDLPKDQQKTRNFFYIQYNNDGFVVSPFDNTIDGYGRLTYTNINLLKRKIKISQLKRNGWRLWLFFSLLGIICSMVILVLCYLFLFKSALIVCIGYFVIINILLIKQFFDTVKKATDY